MEVALENSKLLPEVFPQVKWPAVGHQRSHNTSSLMPQSKESYAVKAIKMAVASELLGCFISTIFGRSEL